MREQLISQQQEKRFRSYCSVLLTVLTYNLSSFYFGYTASYFNSIPYEDTERIFDIKMERSLGEGILSGCISFGGIFGSLASNRILLLLSRKHCFYLANFLSSVGTILVMLQTQEFLIVGRIIQGFCIGYFTSIVPIVVKQYSPVEISGQMGSILNIGFAMGTAFSFSFAYLLSKTIIVPENYWRYVYVVPLAVCGFQQIILMTVFDKQTIKYLLLKGRVSQAKQLIFQVYNEQYHEEVYLEKLKDLQTDICHQQQQKEEPSDSGIAIFLAFSLHVAQQLTGIFIIVLFISELTSEIFNSIHQLIPVLLLCQKFIFSFVGYLVLTKFGRKDPLLIGFFVIGISLFGIFIGFQFGTPEYQLWINVTILVSLFVFILAFILTAGPIIFLYVPEIVQPSIATGCIVINQLTGTILVFLFPLIKEASTNKKCPFVFLFFSLCMFVQFFICKKLMIQTKDKNQIQIRGQFNMLKICGQKS